MDTAGFFYWWHNTVWGVCGVHRGKPINSQDAAAAAASGIKQTQIKLKKIKKTLNWNTKKYAQSGALETMRTRGGER